MSIQRGDEVTDLTGRALGVAIKISAVTGAWCVSLGSLGVAYVNPNQLLSTRAHPRLILRLNGGLIRWDGRTFVGHASDGNEVMIGDNSDNTERYLEHHPNPTDW